MTDEETIQLDIETAKRKVELAEAFQELQKNPYFKKVIAEEYLKKSALENVNRKAAFGFQDEKQQKYVDGQLIAIGHLNQFFHFIMQEGNLAAGALEAHRDELQRVREEG